AMSGLDVVEFVMAGATAVQIGTASFLDPAAPWRILAEFEAWCAAEGVTSVEEIRGVGPRRDRRPRERPRGYV
ncbi:MAG: hypothetical protein WD800_00060, partial [Dehalococcoidia bacterium]